MKRIHTYLLTALILSLALSEVTAKAPGILKTAPEDTIEIQFGDKSKIIIQVDNEEDLKAIKQYDLNAILKDIEVPDDKDLEDEEEVILEDTSGVMYLKEKTESKEFRDLEKEFEDGSDDKDHSEYNYTYKYEKTTKYHGPGNRFVSVMDFGMNNYIGKGDYPDVDNSQFAVRPWGSWYIAIAPTWQTHITGPLALNYGGGISWYNFKFQDSYTRVTKGEDEIIFDRWEPEMNMKKSKLTIMNVDAYLVPMLDFGYKTKVRVTEEGNVKKKTVYHTKGLKAGIGMYVGYRINSYTKAVSKRDGDKSKLRDWDNFYLYNFRYGIRALIGFEDFNFFVNYDLNELFDENRGPELNAFSFGITF